MHNIGKDGELCKDAFRAEQVEIGRVCVTPARRRKIPAVERDVEIDSGFNGAREVYAERLHGYLEHRDKVA